MTTNSRRVIARSFPQTDAGNAEFFARLNKGNVRYVHGRGWLIWQDHWWAEDCKSEILQKAKLAARRRYELALRVSDEEERKQAMGWARRSESRVGLTAMLALAQSEPIIATRAEDWNRDSWLLGVTNGIIDLRTGKRRDGKRSDLITMHSGVSFDPKAQCPHWLSFLDDIFGGEDELINYVQRAVGYCLTGVTTEQVVFLCYGTGANGKTTFLDVLRDAFGDYAYNLPFSTFEMKARSSIPNDVAALPGRRFVTALENNESIPLNEARIKLLTGCDPVSARLLYREFFTFIPTAKFWLATNHQPPVSDDSPGFWRRIRLIPFVQKFMEGRADKDLPQKLRAELPGILRWAVEGCLLWQRQGLGIPEAVQTASQAYRQNNDQLGEFLAEECETAADAMVPAAHLWGRYCLWAEGAGERPLDRRGFSARLETKGFRKQRLGHDRFWAWLGLQMKK